MTRANACVPHLHSHVSQCQRAGYANGRKDALEEIAAELQAQASQRFTVHGGLDQRGAAFWDVSAWLREDRTPAPSPTAAEQVSAARAVADEAAADTARALGDT